VHVDRLVMGPSSETLHNSGLMQRTQTRFRTLAIPAAGGTITTGATFKVLLSYTMLLLNDGSRVRVRERKAEA